VIDDLRGLPLVGRSVTIASVHTTTDDGGRFAILGVPSTYDLVIVDPDGTTVSLYRGLTRRDPLVRHHKSPHDSALPAQVATVTGTLSGGPSWPLGRNDSAGVWIVSPLDHVNALLGGKLPIPMFRGPSFGPVYLRWDGAPTVPAEAYAWSTFDEAGDAGSGEASPPQSFAYGLEPLTLRDGGVSLSLPLVVVPRNAHVAGTVVHPPSAPPTQRMVYYALPPRPGTHLPVGGDTRSAASFDFAVPVLRLPGASLCFAAFSAIGNILAPQIWDCLCGIEPGSPVTAQLQAPPSFTSPAANTTVSPTTTFAWTAFDGGVYELDLVSGQLPSAAAPNIYLYTAATSTTWPDLTAASVSYPADAEYACTIVGLGVYASIDELTGSAGFAAPVVKEFRQSHLPAMNVSVARGRPEDGHH
jgi:hypothetical protein